MKKMNSFRAAFELLHDAVLIVDHKMVIRFSNHSGSKLFGYPHSELVGSNIDMLIPDKLKDTHQVHIDHYVGVSNSRQMQAGRRLKAKTKNGGEFAVSISLNPIEHNGKSMFCVVIRDLSEFSKMEAELLQKKKMESLGVMVGGVAHDINNIMTAISGSVYLARKKPEQTERYLSTIASQCNHATDIVQQLLVVSKDNSIETSNFSLSELFMASQKLFKSAVPCDIDLSFEMDADTENLYIHGSPTLVKQAVINLIINAKDAVEKVKSAFIRIKLKSYSDESGSGRQLCLSISDNGQGMQESMLDRIFEPFYTTKPATKGTGLGLAIVYNVAQVCGGRVDVDSIVGEGTTFTLYLPTVKAPSQKSHRKKTDVENEQTEDFGILLAEDNKAVRKVNRDIIESLGYTVYVAKNGAFAVKKAALFRDDIKLIIMDISMPEMNGVEAAIKIREEGNLVPIIFFSANSGSFNQIDHHESKLYPFSTLTKPFDVLKLRGEIYSLTRA